MFFSSFLLSPLSCVHILFFATTQGKVSRSVFVPLARSGESVHGYAFGTVGGEATRRPSALNLRHLSPPSLHTHEYHRHFLDTAGKKKKNRILSGALLLGARLKEENVVLRRSGRQRRCQREILVPFEGGRSCRRDSAATTGPC